MKYYKRLYAEIIQRFNRNWTAVTWYYFEVGEDNYATKQIDIDYTGKVFKHDEQNLDDEYGGLAEGALELANEQYLKITKTDFYQLWDKNFTNTLLVKELKFNSSWTFSWYNIDCNKTEQELFNGGLIACGSYEGLFLIDIEYLQPDDYLRFQLTKNGENLSYQTCDSWDELVNTAQIWIDKIENNLL